MVPKGSGLNRLWKMVKKAVQAKKAPLKNQASKKTKASLEGLFDPEPIHDTSPEPSSVPSSFSYVDLDLSDLLGTKPNEGQAEGGKSQSIESRMRLDLGDMESIPAEDIIPAAPEKHFDTSEILDVGGWVIVDLGETGSVSNSSWASVGTTPKTRRKNRYGVIPVGDLPNDVPVSGGILSYEDALDSANQLNELRDIMES